jgi:prepilin-type N-terminal cleavage/methylation domain-containing protein
MTYFSKLLRGMRHHGSLCSRRQAGFTLIEFALVLGVFGLVSGAVWVAAGNAQDARKINESIDQIRLIVENIRDRYNTASQLPNEGYAAFTQTIASADLVPAEMRLTLGLPPANCGGATPCAFAHSWSSNGTGSICNGGTVCVSAVNAFSGVTTNRYAMTVLLRQLPGKACIAIGAALLNLGADLGLAAMGTDAPVGMDAAAPTAQIAAPTIAWLTANCSTVVPNNLYLDFRLAP